MSYLPISLSNESFSGTQTSQTHISQRPLQLGVAIGLAVSQWEEFTF